MHVEEIKEYIQTKTHIGQGGFLKKVLVKFQIRPRAKELKYAIRVLRANMIMGFSSSSIAHSILFLDLRSTIQLHLNLLPATLCSPQSL